MKFPSFFFLALFTWVLVACSGSSPQPEETAQVKPPAEVALSFPLTTLRGRFSLFRAGKLIRAKPKTKLFIGDLLWLQPKAAVELTLPQGGKLTLGGNSILLAQPWQGRQEGHLVLAHGQALMELGGEEVQLKTPFGVLRAFGGSAIRLAVGPGSTLVVGKKGKCQLRATRGGSQSLQPGQAAAMAGVTRVRLADEKSLQIPKSLDSPSIWEARGVGLWPLERLTALRLIDLEDWKEDQLKRKKEKAPFAEHAFFTLVEKKEKEKLKNVVWLNDQLLFIDPHRKDWKQRPLNDTTQVLITFEK